MSSMSVGKVVPGGILAGIVLAGLDFVVQNYILASDWQNVARLRNVDISAMGGVSALVTTLAVDVVLGQLLVMTYAGIRPRFGPGPGTAAIASLIVFLAQALSLATFAGFFFNWDLYIRQTALTLVAMLAAGWAGAWVYTEDEG